MTESLRRVLPPPSCCCATARAADAKIEVFMMVRHHQIEFNSGALVFPGGSVDKNDKEIVARPELYTGGEGLDAAALGFRIAAIRETFEESGILLARPKGSTALVDARRAGEIEAAHRAELNERKITFLKVLTDNGMVLALDELVPYAHWITPEGMPKRFDTWFFLAAAPPDQLGAHDGRESTNSIWVSPREALEGGESGRFKLPFPTTRNLIKLGKQAERAATRSRTAEGKDDRHRDAGHDAAQRRPPAPHSARKPAMTANCSRSARSADMLRCVIEVFRPCPAVGFRLRLRSGMADMEDNRSTRASLAGELALLLLLATLWGASYSFIKLGVATIPPITLIALRTLIAGVLLLLIMRWRGVKMPTDAATWRRFAFQACLNSVIPWTLIAWGERTVDAGLATILNSAAPIFTFLFTALVTRHEAASAAKAVRRDRGHGRHLPDRRGESLRSVGQELVAEIAIVAATICYACGAIFSRGFAGLDPMAPAAGSLALRHGGADPARPGRRAALDR